MSTTQTGHGRADRILHWLQAEGRLDVADVAGRLGVAQETVRRDLRTLELEQKLQRVHGGAVPTPAPTLAAVAAHDHAAFGAQVWARLPRVGTVLIGAGRLATALAEAMVAQPPEAEGLTVVTNHLDVAVVLSRAPRLSVYNIGGTVSRTTHAQEGDWALAELGRLHTDVAVLSPAGISLDGGVTEGTPAAAAVTRAEIDGTQRLVVLADAASLGATAFVRACELDEIDLLAVADDVPTAMLRGFADRGVEVSWLEADGATSSSTPTEGGR